jgi:hypothetical protein
LRSGDTLLARAERQGEQLLWGAKDLLHEILESAAWNLAGVWAGSQPASANTPEFLAELIRQKVGEHARAMLELLSHLRSDLEQTLQSAKEISFDAGHFRDQLPVPTGLPVLDPKPVADKLVLQKPVLLATLGQRLLRRYIRPRLKDQIGPALADLLSLYRHQLRTWFQEALAESREAYTSTAGVYSARLEHRRSEPISPESSERVKKDIQELENWAS